MIPPCFARYATVFDLSLRHAASRKFSDAAYPEPPRPFFKDRVFSAYGQRFADQRLTIAVLGEPLPHFFIPLRLRLSLGGGGGFALRPPNRTETAGVKPNAAVIRRWFGSRVERNIGIRTGAASKFWVLDVDDPVALAGLEARHGSLPATRIVATSRGRHYWWRLGAMPVPSSAGRIAPHLDARGESGYVLASPSVHPDGVVYAWGNDAPLVEAPAWLVERAIGKTTPTARLRWPS